MDRLPCIWIDEDLEGLKKINKFWHKVKAVDSGCWEWQGSAQPRRYGKFWLGKKCISSHRAAWKLTRFYIPENYCVCHRCDNPLCCNPAHLFIGTILDNNRDKFEKGRQARGDKSGAILHPETLARGDCHGSRLHPERMARGDAHYSRLCPERLARGENHGGAKLNAEKVLEIRLRISAGESQTNLAKEFGVSIATISNIHRRNNWTHVQAPDAMGISKPIDQ
jgi:hypothetical protein